MNTNDMTLTEMLAYYESCGPLTLVPPSDDDLMSPKRVAKQLAEGVKPGQLWIAGDNEADYGNGLPNLLYVMVVETRGEFVTVVPLSTDLRAQTEDSWIIENGCPLEEPTVVWPRIKAIIPSRLLSTPLKEFKPATANAIIENDMTLADPADKLESGYDHEENEAPYVETREDNIATLLKWHTMCFKRNA